jgi:hypothetical protein
VVPVEIDLGVLASKLGECLWVDKEMLQRDNNKSAAAAAAAAPRENGSAQGRDMKMIYP